jgi:hypothetical protein
VAIRPAQKGESPGFQTTFDIALEPTYFLFQEGLPNTIFGK